MMVRSLGIAATGMVTQQANVDTIANNIANVGSTAFKRRRAEFQDLLYQNVQSVGAQSSATGTTRPTGIQFGLGVKLASIYSINTQGTLVETGNQFDLAIDGRGYFSVQLPSGENAYTRAGSFQVNENGELVTSNGYLVNPGITIPQEAVEVSINEEGEVQVKLDGQTELSNVGQVELNVFPNEAGLEAQGDNLYLETTASGSPVTGFGNDNGFGRLRQNYIEGSNVDSVTEVTSLITAQRGFELNSRVIQTTDEMLQTITQQT